MTVSVARAAKSTTSHSGLIKIKENQCANHDFCWDRFNENFMTLTVLAAQGLKGW